MPQVGETRTVGSETRQWTGNGWQRIEAPAAGAPEQPGAFSRFVSGAASTTPFNPMNILHAVAHPIDTIGHMAVDPMVELLKAGGSFSDAVTNPTNEGILGRVTNAVEGVKHLGGAVPFIGKAATDAGTKIGNGDFAGGAGELAGLASSALLPEAAERAPGAVRSIGQGAERVGSVVGNTKIGGYGVPALGVAEALMRHDPMGLVAAAAPTVVEHGGRLLQRASDLMDGLRGGEQPEMGPYVPNESGYVPGQAAAEGASSMPIPESPVDRYMPNTSAAPAVDESGMTAQEHNINRNAPYGNGQVIPDAMKPTEYLDHILDSSSEAIESPNRQKPYDLDYGGVMPDFNFEGSGQLDPRDQPPTMSLNDGPLPKNRAPEEPSFSYEGTAAEPNGHLPESPIDNGADLSPDWEKELALKLGEVPDSSNLIDISQKFGPGSTTGAGDLAQAAARKGEPGYQAGADRANLIYDPQTPTSYLQQLRDDALNQNDPAGADFYGRALDQRHRISLTMEGLKPPKGLRLLDVKPFTKP